MESATVSALHDLALDSRALLQKEMEEQLEGIYGWLPSGKFQPPDKYPALSQVPEASDMREDLEQFLSDEKTVGVDARDARQRLVREAAFTWLNRLVAFKMMEARGLIKGTVSKGPDSNAFKLWLVEEGHEAEYEKYELGDLPQNALGEGPRQEAYRHFLLWQCGKLAEEVRVLFDPVNRVSCLCPRPTVLQALVGLMNSEALREAWAPGNEETIGWIYQYFNEKEKKEVFHRVYNQKKKIGKDDLPAASQIFTPRWIVKFLIQNSLGRMWVQMHPDTRLAETMDYLVPVEGAIPPVPLKQVKQIRMLDPACGTMHFGLVAFDLFVQMYREEMEKVGIGGWPQESSVCSEEEVPAAIIANNLYGMDIDLRAVQLSALALYLKAKSVNKDTRITESNLACCDVLQFDDVRLSDFLNEMNFSSPLYDRIIKGLWEHLQDLNLMGSLVRLETHMRDLIQEEEKKYKTTGKQPLLPGLSPDQFDREAGDIEFWETIEAQIVQALDHYAKVQAERGRNVSFFTGEAVKGFKVLDLMMRRYDVVATNPPYMFRRNMVSSMTGHLDRQYWNAKGDLYSAFIVRCANFLKTGGRVAMITQQSFMFLSTYEKMRMELSSEYAIESMSHVGPRAFEEVSGEKVNATCFILRSESGQDMRGESFGLYFRLVKEPDGESKRNRLELALMNLKEGQADPLVFRYRQGDFDSIPGSPWVYWITPKIRDFFNDLPRLSDIAQPRVGLQTGDNLRFLRFWWEVGSTRIAFGCTDCSVGMASKKKWFPYMKGGSLRRWWGNQDFVVNWYKDGQEVRMIGVESGKVASRPQNTSSYFHRGVTWSDLTSGRFSARLSPGGFIFDVKGSSAFPENIPLVLGLLNSSFANYILNLINPTVSYQVGDISRLPIAIGTSSTLKNLVETAIRTSRCWSEEDETTFEFVMPPPWPEGTEQIVKRTAELNEIECNIDDEIYQLYDISDHDRKLIEVELNGSIRFDLSDEDPDVDTDFSIIESLQSFTQDVLAGQYLSYSIGVALGRFKPWVSDSLGRGCFPDPVNHKLRGLSCSDGLLVMDKGHPDDISKRTLEVLSAMLSETGAQEVVRAAQRNEGDTIELLRQYVARDFFKLHIKQYRKRPVYWFLQSPKKKYGIWVFHERLTKDTLFRVRSEYVQPKIRLLESQIADIQNRVTAAEGKEKRRLEREMTPFHDIVDDVREFERRLKYISEVRGYTPHIDDGVVLNMAPLWDLIPSWQAEPKKAWQELEAGKYDWSYQAMDHWPKRVTEKCKTNKSFAIAHRLLNLYDERS